MDHMWETVSSRMEMVSFGSSFSAMLDDFEDMKACRVQAILKLFPFFLPSHRIEDHILTPTSRVG